MSVTLKQTCVGFSNKEDSASNCNQSRDPIPSQGSSLPFARSLQLLPTEAQLIRQWKEEETFLGHVKINCELRDVEK